MDRMTARRGEEAFVVCVQAAGYAASLELRKVYRTVPDPEAARRGLLRVVDESGEDYLFPKECFETVELSASAASVFAADS